MKKLGDTFTILLLIAAFGMAYYTGFIGQTANGKPMLGTDVFAIISMLGMLVLFVIGPVSALVSRAKNNLITVGFIALFCVEVLALLAVCAMMVMLWTRMFDADCTAIRVLYIICTVIGVIGFVDALLFSDCLAARDAALAPETEEEVDDDDDDDEDEEEEEGDDEDEDDSQDSVDSKDMFLGF